VSRPGSPAYIAYMTSSTRGAVERARDLRLAHSLSAADASLPGLRCSAAIDWSRPWDGGRDPYADSPAARSIHWIPDAEGERGE
jgi:hypothetical protein